MELGEKITGKQVLKQLGSSIWALLMPIGIVMGMREKLLTGELYACDDDSVAAEQATWLEKVYEYNMTRPSEPEKRKAMLENMFAHLGKGCYIEPPFHANWGGRHVHFAITSMRIST